MYVRQLCLTSTGSVASVALGCVWTAIGSAGTDQEKVTCYNWIERELKCPMLYSVIEKVET